MDFRKFLLALAAVAPLAFAGSVAWTATFGQVGPLTIGMPLPRVNEILGAQLTPPAVPAQAPTGKCFYAAPTQAAAVDLMFIANRLARIDVVRGGIKTAQGISVGDAEASVRSAYGSRATTTSAFYSPQHGQYITVLSGDGQYGIRFLLVNGRVRTYYVGTARSIQYVEGCG